MDAPASTRTRAGLPAAVAAAVLGLLYALLNLVWTAGGDLGREAYGTHLVGADPQDDGTFRVVSAVLVVLFLLAVGAGLRAVLVRDDAKDRPAARYGAWIAAGLLALYGAGTTLVGLGVQLSLIGADNGDPRIWKFHAFLFSPWFLVWGVLLAVALIQSQRAFLASGHKADYY